MKGNRVFILLGIYDGEQYLEEQIKSIQAQTYQNWELIIRDDNAKNNPSISIRDYAKKDKRIRLLNDCKGNLGVLNNYNVLMLDSLRRDADIILFCDQDDVWLSDKIQMLVDAIGKMEQQHGKNCPVLVHSDMTVVDKLLMPIHQSFMSSCMHLKNIPKVQLPLLLPGNYIAGCSTAINRDLLRLATPIPKEAVIHDWWVALCAAACGKILYIDKPMVLYRQHERNTVGAKNIASFFSPLGNHIQNQWITGHRHFIHSVRQASALQTRVGNKRKKMNLFTNRLIDTYASCLKEGPAKRLRTIRNSGIRRQHFFYHLLFLTRLLLTPTVKKDIQL